ARLRGWLESTDPGLVRLGPPPAQFQVGELAGRLGDPVTPNGSADANAGARADGGADPNGSARATSSARANGDAHAHRGAHATVAPPPVSNLPERVLAGVLSVGIDLQVAAELIDEEAARDPKSSAELARIFSARELSYAIAKGTVRDTLAGLFAAKEAL